VINLEKGAAGRVARATHDGRTAASPSPTTDSRKREVRTLPGRLRRALGRLSERAGSLKLPKSRSGSRAREAALAWWHENGRPCLTEAPRRHCSGETEAVPPAEKLPALRPRSAPEGEGDALDRVTRLKAGRSPPRIRAGAAQARKLCGRTRSVAPEAGYRPLSNFLAEAERVVEDWPRRGRWPAPHRSRNEIKPNAG